jgi:hypothetical protein
MLLLLSLLSSLRVRQKRALAAASWAAKEAVEQQVASQAERELARAEQSSQRERRRWKLAQMQADLEREQQQVQEGQFDSRASSFWQQGCRPVLTLVPCVAPLLDSCVQLALVCRPCVPSCCLRARV